MHKKTVRKRKYKGLSIYITWTFVFGARFKTLISLNRRINLQNRYTRDKVTKTSVTTLFIVQNFPTLSNWNYDYGTYSYCYVKAITSAWLHKVAWQTAVGRSRCKQMLFWTKNLRFQQFTVYVAYFECYLEFWRHNNKGKMTDWLTDWLICQRTVQSTQR